MPSKPGSHEWESQECAIVYADLYDDCGDYAPGGPSVRVLDAEEWTMVASRTRDEASITLLRRVAPGPPWEGPWAVVSDDGGAGWPEAWMWGTYADARDHLAHVGTWDRGALGIIARELLVVLPRREEGGEGDDE